MTDETKGRILAERLFAAGKVEWPRYALPFEEAFKRDLLPSEADDLACMAIVRALREANHTVRTCPLPDNEGIWWSTTAHGSSELRREHFHGTTDLLALALLACKVFGVDSKVNEK